MGTVSLVRGPGGPARRCVPNGGSEGDPNTFHLRVDPTTESVAVAIVNAAAFVHNVEQTELEPLETAIDTDALADLLRHGQDRSGTPLEVSFTYEGFDIAVDSNGNIWLRWS